MKSVVSIARTRNEPDRDEVERAVRSAVDLAGGLGDLIRIGSRVLIKPNLVAVASAGSGIITSPEVCRALARIAQELGGLPTIADSAFVGEDTEKAIVAGGYAALREEGFTVLDLKKRPTVKMEIPQGKVLKSITTSDVVAEADVILNAPVMKTHDSQVVTLGLKNIKGLLADKDKRRMHKVSIPHGVSDVNSVLKPTFTLLDGVVGREGRAPLAGRPVPLGLLIGSRDIVALDSIASAIMGVSPADVPIIVHAAERGLGVMDRAEIEVRGERVEDLVHPFLAACDDCEIDRVEDFFVHYGEETCTGCKMLVQSSLVEMQDLDQLGYLKGVTVLVGDAEMPEGVSEDAVVRVGLCVPKGKRRGNWVRGCPPDNPWVEEAIVNAHRKIKR